MLRRTLAVVAVAAFTLVGCDSQSPSDPTPDSDSQQVYADGHIPTDLHVYDITGTVTASPSSLTRQVSPAHGDVFGVNGYVSGSFFGPVEAGKGFVRVTVKAATPATDLAPPGDVIVLKMTDTKGTALLPGDTVKFRCRRQYEAVAAVQESQHFDVTSDATWELDYCRLASPVISVGPQGGAG